MDIKEDVADAVDGVEGEGDGDGDEDGEIAGRSIAGAADAKGALVSDRDMLEKACVVSFCCDLCLCLCFFGADAAAANSRGLGALS
jgi:hypothetical protein